MTLHELPLTIHPSPEALGQQTAARAAATINHALTERGNARVMLAAAPSQQPTLEHLALCDIDFSRVDFFHMDDYLGLHPAAPQGFGNWLQTHFINLLPTTPRFHRIDPTLEPDQAADTYATQLGDTPFDLTLCGLGVNAHLAFNDPPANFTDPRKVRPVHLEIRSRQQQVNEGHFPTLDDVPPRALTVTIPRLLNAGHVICSVLGSEKAWAVAETLHRNPDPEVPGTALKTHPHAELHTDTKAAANV